MIFKKSDLPDSWQSILAQEFDKTYMKDLCSFLDKETETHTVYPASNEIFNALKLTDFSQVKAVIIGQDPYHGPGQAHGLCFSVTKGVPPPPSLVNIFKELKSDLGISISPHGCLEDWAEQGVLLLNSCLTVRQHKAASHAGRGWEQFTDKVITELAVRKKNLVFILWGSAAQKKVLCADMSEHFVIKSVHPSPLSAYRGFSGSKPFSRCNDYLRCHGLGAINWELSK